MDGPSDDGGPSNLSPQSEATLGEDAEAKLKYNLRKTSADLERFTEKVSEMKVAVVEMEMELTSRYNPQLLENIRQISDQ